jgi:Putative adhesin
MKLWLLLTLLTPAAFAESRGTCSAPFEASFRHGSELQLDIRSGDIDISGSDTPVVRVSCELKSPDEAGNVIITFSDTGSRGRLRIHGGPRDEVRLHIEVPKESHLVVRCTAGDLDVVGVRGNKDVSLRAGDLNIAVGDAAEYASAEASVTAGDLHAGAFGVHKGGLFRSFKKQNASGKYRLRASLWAGDLTLR